MMWVSMRMNSRVMLLLLRDDRPVRAVEVGERGLHIGRARTADICLVDTTVSQDHARVWAEGGRVFLRDLSSRNGSFVNDKRIHGQVEVQDQDRLRLGLETHLQVRVTGAIDAGTELELIDLDAGVRHALAFGDNEIEGFVVRVGRDGECRVITPTSEQVVEVDLPFELGSLHLLICGPDAGEPSTREVDHTVLPYRIEASLNGASGPEARMTDLRRPGSEVRIASATQAEVLFVLAQRLRAEQARGMPEPGWIGNSDLRLAVWGRQAERLHRSRLPVVLHRIRKVLEEGGLDSDCLARRRGATRLAIAEVELR